MTWPRSPSEAKAMSGQLEESSQSGRELSGLAPVQVYPAGVELFQQGLPARNVYLIEQGLIKLLRVQEDGQEVIVGLRRPGWCVGAAAVIIGTSYPVTAITVTRSHLSHIAGEGFRNLLKSDHSVSWRVHQMHSSEVCAQMIHLAELGCLPARKRLERLIWDLLVAQRRHTVAGPVKLDLPLRHWEIAQLIAVTPVHLSRLLDQLEADGVIRRSKGWLIICDIDRLWRGEQCC